MTINSEKFCYGEYIVYRASGTGPQTVEEELYHRIFEIFRNYRNDLYAGQKLNPFKDLKESIVQIDPSLNVFLLPKTLYQLEYVKLCVEENFFYGKFCHEENNFRSTEAKRSKKGANRCWHIPRFSELTDDHFFENDSFNFNNYIVNNFINCDYKQKLEYLLEFYERINSSHPESSSWQKIDTMMRAGPGYNNPTGRFSVNRKDLFHCAINSEKEKNLVRKSFELEVSDLAHDHLFLYRGDYPHDASSKSYHLTGYYNTISFGSSLFAGGLHDSTACAYGHITKKNFGYAIAVPYKNIPNAPFYIPATSALTELAGYGETWHPRKKSFDDGTADPKKLIMTGVNEETFNAIYKIFEDNRINLF